MKVATNIEDIMFAKEAKKELRRIEHKRDKIITLIILIPATAYLIGNLLEWGLR